VALATLDYSNTSSVLEVQLQQRIRICVHVPVQREVTAVLKSVVQPMPKVPDVRRVYALDISTFEKTERLGKEYGTDRNTQPYHKPRGL